MVGTSESNDVDISDARGDYDVWVIKLNPEGQYWEKFLGEVYDGANAVALDGNENTHILGHTLSQDADISSPIGNADIWLVKLNQGGELLHELTLWRT